MKFLQNQGDAFLFILPLLCFGLAGAVSWLDAAKRFEWRTLDWRTQVRAELGQPPPDERILVIGVGERSALNIEPWPFRRSYHGQLQFLSLHDQPKVWSWDVIFMDRTGADGTAVDAESDRVFAIATEEMTKAGVPVVFAAVSVPDPTGDDLAQLGLTRPLTRIEGDASHLLGDPHATLPYPGLREHGYFGMADAPRGAGGIVRHMPMVVRVGEHVLPALALQTAMRFWAVEADDVTVVPGRWVDLGPKSGGVRIPIDERGRMLINYRYEKMEPGDPLGLEFSTVEYFDQLVGLRQVYVDRDPGARPPAPMAGKIVMVGEFSTDAGPSPRADHSPLVLLQANVLNNILQADFVRRAPVSWVWGGAVLMGYLGIGLLRRRSVVVLVVFTAAVVLGFTWLVFAMWMRSNLWIPFAAPLAGFLLLQFGFIAHRVVAEQMARAQMRSMFGSYLAPVVVNQMVDSGKLPELGGIESELTAYFSDIEGFSSFSEQLAPPQLVSLLNEYLTACTDIIQEEGGTLDKYIGDAVVAMFGAPVALPDHAHRAAVAALRVQSRLEEMRAEWTAAGATWPPLVHRMRTRIGLNTGPCMIGNMGSRTRFDYTMMGDNVNLAARMESGAKSWGAYTMVTEATRTASERHGGDRLVYRRLGRILVQGRSQPVPIHELVGLRENVSDQTRECVATFERGLERYWQRDWAGAAEAFELSAQRERLQPGRDPGVKLNPSLVYQKIVREAMTSPPPEPWNGVYAMTQK